MCADCSHHTESIAVFNGIYQLFLQLFLCLVLWQEQLVEASVGCGQLVFFASDAYDEVNVFEARDWGSVGARRKGKQLLALLIREIIEYNIPEPIDEIVFQTQGLYVLGHCLQLIEVQVLRATYELLQFLRCVK